jgi:DNA invertase Pin-like site-specific DNA recombinase
MTAVVYIRVSLRKGQKTYRQRAELEAWLKRQHIKGARWFEDRDSARMLQRDAFQKLQASIFAGQVDTVACGNSTALLAALRKVSTS